MLRFMEKSRDLAERRHGFQDHRHQPLGHPSARYFRRIDARALLRRAVAREAEILVNNRLTVLRAERDWSQADLAQRLAVSRQTINSIETEKYDPSLPLALIAPP